MHHICHYTLPLRATFHWHCLPPSPLYHTPTILKLQSCCCLNTFRGCYSYSRVNMKVQCMVQPMYSHAIPTKAEFIQPPQLCASSDSSQFIHLICRCDVELFQLIFWYIYKCWVSPTLKGIDYLNFSWLWSTCYPMECITGELY